MTQQRNPAQGSGADRPRQGNPGNDRRPAGPGPDRRDNRQPVDEPRREPRDNRPPQDRHPHDRDYQNRAAASQPYHEQEYDSRGYSDQGYDEYPDGSNLPATAGGPGADARDIVPTRDGSIGSINPTPQRNFITLVNTRSAMAQRGEAEAGMFYSRNLGNMNTVIAEVRGCYYRQRYSIYDERNNTFRTFCEATAPTIDQLWGKGRPGVKCTECHLTQWREETIEGTGETKRQPPLCTEHVIFELFIHDVAANAFWDLSALENLHSIRNTINILNDRFGWANYVVEIYASAHVNSRGETRYTPHIRTRPDIPAFNSPKVIEGEAQVITQQDLQQMAILSQDASPDSRGRPSNPANRRDEPPPYVPADDEEWHEQQEDDLPF